MNSKNRKLRKKNKEYDRILENTITRKISKFFDFCEYDSRLIYKLVRDTGLTAEFIDEHIEDSFVEDSYVGFMDIDDLCDSLINDSIYEGCYAYLKEKDSYGKYVSLIREGWLLGKHIAVKIDKPYVEELIGGNHEIK